MKENIVPQDDEAIPGPIAVVLILFSTALAICLGLVAWSLVKMFGIRRPHSGRHKGPEK